MVRGLQILERGIFCSHRRDFRLSIVHILCRHSHEFTYDCLRQSDRYCIPMDRMRGFPDSLTSIIGLGRFLWVTSRLTVRLSFGGAKQSTSFRHRFDGDLRLPKLHSASGDY